MEQFIPSLISVFCAGVVVGILIGWYIHMEYQRRENRKMAEQMARSVGARRSQRKPEDMMEYQSRQRVKNNDNNGKKARQAIFRPRRIMRRPTHRG